MRKLSLRVSVDKGQTDKDPGVPGVGNGRRDGRPGPARGEGHLTWAHAQAQPHRQPGLGGGDHLAEGGDPKFWKVILVAGWGSGWIFKIPFSRLLLAFL